VGGTAFVDGRNYTIDPNNPSYINEASGITVSKIYRYRQSGSDWAYDTNGGAGYTDIDPTQYSLNGVLTPVASNDWSIQRVFYFPNSGTKAFYIYYGNASYANEDLAFAGVGNESFSEALNTAANAIYVGYILVRNNADFTVPASYTIYPAGLFRGSGGGGGTSGGGGATSLASLSDVAISSPTSGQPLVYNSATAKWQNTSYLSASISGNSVSAISASIATTASYALTSAPSYIDNFITVGLSGSNTNYSSIKTAVDSITDASANNTYTVKVYPGVYIEDTINMKSWVAVKGDSSISTVVSASNPSQSVFVMADQSMIIDMQVQGSTYTGSSAIYYSSPTTPQTNAISYAENIRFGTNYTNATCAGSGSGNCILQCSNVKYGGFTEGNKSFDIGFRVTGSGGSIGRMQLRNVTSTNGGVAGSDANQIFALADAPGCTFIVNGCLLTRATGTATGTGFKVYNGGSLRLTAVNFQRWINGIWAPQTGSAPSIDAIALNFENCTYDVLIEHTGSTGKVQGTDNFLKTIIPATASLYEVGQDPRRLMVAKKGGDFTSISASVAWITDSSADNRYVIEVGPGQFTEKTIDLTGKPYVSIVGSNIQTTEIFPSSSAQHLIKLGINNEVSFLSLANAGSGYAGLYVDDIGDFGQAHKISFYNCDTNVFVASKTQDTQFYGEYLDYNGTYTYGTRVSASNGFGAYANIENYYQFPSGSIATIGNLSEGEGADLNIAVASFDGTNIGVSGGTAIQIQSSGSCDVTSTDVIGWDYGLRTPNVGGTPRFNINGTVFRDNITYDFYIQNSSTNGRFQGSGDHTKISNVSNDFYWSFMDITDGEYDITRKLSVTFDDGTHTDATTLIFNGSPMGVMSGGDITIVSGLTISTSAGFGYCKKALATDVYQRVDWVDSQITLPANSENYIYINAGGLTSALTKPSNVENIIIGRVVTNATGIEFIDPTQYVASHMPNLLSDFNREALGSVYESGSIVTENATPFKLNVTAGSYYFSENHFTPSGTSSINLNQYYRSGSAWSRTTSSIVPSNTYNSGSGGTLTAMSASYYTKHTLYGVGDGIDEEYFLVIGQNQYATLIETEAADLPTPPSYFSRGVVSLASIYVQSGSANITKIQDIRPIIGFKATGLGANAVHGNLLGLTADDHTQYLLVSGTRQMAGNLGLGGNTLYNFSLVSGSAITASSANITTIRATSITGSLFGTASWAQNAVTSSYILNAVSASFASTASYVVTALTASYVTASNIVGTVTSASFASTASYVVTAQTASYVTASNIVGTVASASYAATASFAPLYVLTSATSSMSVASASQAATASSADNFTVRGTLTAQTIVAQTITASTEFITGSSKFGSLLANTHQFTGSILVTGSITVSNGVTNNLTASWANNALTASYVTASNIVGTVASASFASTASYWSGSITNAISSSFASTASYVVTAQTASYVTASNIIGTVASSSFASTASYVITAQTASYVTASNIIGTVTSASFASTASYVVTALTASYVTASNIIGTVASSSFASTASYVVTAQTASYITASNIVGTVTSASFAATAALAPNYVLTSATASMLSPYILNSQTSSFVTNAQTSSFATTGSNTFRGNQVITGSVNITGSTTITGSLNVSQGITSSLFGTSSWAQNAVTSSYVLQAVSASYWSGSITNAISSSFASTASYVVTALTASYVTASNIVGTVASASFASTASYVVTAQTASYVTASNIVGTVTSASFASTASYVVTALTASYITASNIVGTVTSSSFASTASYVVTAQTASYVTASNIVGTVASASFASTASYVVTAQTASYVTASNVIGTVTSASYAVTASFAPLYVLNSQTSSFATTGSNIFRGNQTISGSLTITGSTFLTGSLSILGTVSASGYSGSLFGTSSWATSASFAVSASWAPSSGGSGLATKAGSVTNTSFAGNPKKATVNFASAFGSTNYAIIITGEDARSWTVESKAAGSFIINTNSNTGLAGTTYWIATAFGETV